MQNHLLNSLPAPQHIQTILNLFEDEIRTRLMHHKSVDRIRAISYAASYNDGTIYYIKAGIGKNEFVHLKLYFSLPSYGNGPVLASLIPDRKLHEPFFIF